VKARDLMTTDIACATPDTPAREAAKLMLECDCGALPVVEDDRSRKLVGVVTDRDIAVRGVARGNTPETPVRELMTREVVTCSPEDEVEHLERAMAQSQVRRVPIVEDGGRCVGIVAQADLALDGRAVSDLGQIVGRISEPRRGSH
jgi:CBS domain-containing protein